MSKKEDFLKFYLQHKDEHGYVTLEDISKNFEVEVKEETGYIIDQKHIDEWKESIDDMAEELG